MTRQVEKWGRYELTLDGPTEGNPFIDVKFSASFNHNGHIIEIDGFYDGHGKYTVRYMPEVLGIFRVTTHSNVADLDGKADSFEVINPSKDNHGPVRVANKTHFEYADGTGYIPMGTTAYAWTVQPKEVRDQTLETLRANKFNKIRMTVFPKNYNYNTTEPELYPYEGKPTSVKDSFDFSDWMMSPEDIGFDFEKFIPEYFQSLEYYVEELDKMGIEADLILFHPYDHWGFARMGMEKNKLYLKYIIARLASYKNIWWSLANEYDLMDLCGQISLGEWDELGQFVRETDPSQHLASIHNWYDPPQHKHTTANWYDYSKPWVTHLSVQTDNIYFVPKWMAEYRKPVVIDECRYEGNIEFGWGDNTAKGMMDMFWRGILRGGGVTHGETYIDQPDTDRPIWWAHGGKLYGESQKKINFLEKVLCENDFEYVIPQAVEGPHWELAAGANPSQDKILVYFGENQPEFEVLDFLPEGKVYTGKLLNAWDETEKDFDQEVSADRRIHIPRKDFQVLLLKEK